MGDSPMSRRESESASPPRAPGSPSFSDSTLDRLQKELAAQTAAADPHADPGSPIPSLELPGYRLIREIHRGGQGIVYLALQESTRRNVAIKMMREGPFASADDRARFDREVRILARLKHPNIVAIHDSGRIGDHFYYVMAYVDGQPLDRFGLGNGPTSSKRLDGLDKVLQLFAKVCRAVETAHELGIVHRDLKPTNILATPEGEPFILDFGLAKTTPGTAVDESTPVVTMTGLFLGSLPWSSPEQVMGQSARLDARTDVYSLGVILYQLLTGRFPYDVVGDLRSVQDRIISSVPIDLRSIVPGLPRDLETLILKCLAKEPERRYASAGALARDIEHFRDGQPIEARRDSLRYVVQTRSRRLIRRHPILLAGAIILSGTVMAQELGGRAIFEWTSVGRASDRWLTSSFPGSRISEPFEHVRVIALSDGTPVDELARGEGFTDVSIGNMKSVRRLHGALFKRLSRTGVRAVVSAIGFRGETPYDAGLAEGIRLLRNARIDVVVGIGNWWLGSGVPEGLSASIASDVSWGSANGVFGFNDPWRINLVAQRGQADPLPSLALAALAASRHPGMGFDLSLDHDSRAVNICYWEADATIPKAKRRVNAPDRVDLSALSPALPDKSIDIDAGDLIGTYLIDVPADAALAASTIEYADAMRADDSQLEKWCGGRVVVLGSTRSDVPRFPHDGRSPLAGCYAHATGIEQLLSDSSFHRPLPTMQRALCILGAATGWAVVRQAQISASLRMTLFVTIMLMGVGASVMAYREFQYVCNPLVPLSAMIAAWLLAWLSSKA